MVSIGNDSLAGVPYLLVIAGVTLVGLEAATRMTTWGVHLRATGNALAVARLSGVRVERTLISAYLASGILSAAAGTLLAANLSTAGPLQGEPYTLAAVAGCVIGGVDLMGGRGRLWAAAAGTVFLAAVRAALDLQGVQPFMQGLVTGILIILAVFLTTRGPGLRLWFARSLRRLRFGVPE
jgi:ribose/xylose/arabinose/galactoside ABC-type transport system permease subunit